MSDFVEFPDKVYADAGNVFAKFDGTTTRYTPDNALAMMWFAQLAYEVDETGQNKNGQKIEMVCKLWEFASITPFLQRKVAPGSALHTTGLIGQRKDAVVLAFAGTDPAIWETVATDAKFRLGTKDTHEGFQAAFDAVAPPGANGKVSGPVGDAIALRTDKQELFVTGHSLGAAIGIIAAAAAAAESVKPQAVYGFGTPRPGGTAFRQAYNASLGDRTYRLVHGRDIVARVPMFPGYVHVGCMLRCKQGTKFETGKLPSLSSDPVFSPDYINEIAAFLLGGGVLGLLKSLVMNLPQDVTELAQVVKAKLPQRGKLPLDEWFPLLPPFIREHLQDRYIEALTPGAIKIRGD